MRVKGFILGKQYEVGAVIGALIGTVIDTVAGRWRKARIELDLMLTTGVAFVNAAPWVVTSIWAFVNANSLVCFLS